MIRDGFRRFRGCVLLLFAVMLVTAVYWPGLHGSWLFDDYPNIVDNHEVQPSNISVASLVSAALSSPASEFKRPLASLSFAANFLASGLDPYAMKLTNLVIHLLNGLLVFVLARLLLRSAGVGAHPVRDESLPGWEKELSRTGCAPTEQRRPGVVAALIAAGWVLLPINLTAVLYVVQRMESMANVFVLLGLIGYVVGRQRMLAANASTFSPELAGRSFGTRGFILCLVSVTVPTAIGLLAKETAVMLPLYALLVEWALFRWRKPSSRNNGGRFRRSENVAASAYPSAPSERELPITLTCEVDRQAIDWRVITLFLVVLVLPMILGLTWLVPGLLKPAAWASRDFTMGTRLLSESRIVVDYIRWTLLPTPDALSFYHDDFRISTGLLTPWSTLASLLLLAALVMLIFWLRARRPLAALGIALFLGCQLLTGTILQLELIYEHRNYFASFGLLLAVVPLLAVPRSFPLARPRYVLLAGLLLCWATLTAITAYAWGDPLRLAQELAARAPESPRAQYELGRTYIIYSHYDPASPYTQLAYAPLEKAADFPESSILPQQALLFMNSRMHLPLKAAWWQSLIAKLTVRKPGVQDESSLSALTQCARERECDLPQNKMIEAFNAALSHPQPDARLFASYGDYAWNVLENHTLGEHLTEQAVAASPAEPAYQITLIRMLAAQGQKAKALVAISRLKALNLGGRLDDNLMELQALPGLK